MSTEALALVKTDGPGASVLMRRATDAAGACKEIVLRTAQSIQGKKYVKVEGWQAIANTFGCVASACEVENVDGGVRAIGEVRRMSDGAVVATGEGFVGDDEPTWMKRPVFARRAMAQTRAISRACRSAFAFVVVLIDANLQTTPAEEMAGAIEYEHPPKPSGSGTAALKAKVEPIAAAATAKPSAQTVEAPRQSRMKIRDEPPPHDDADAPAEAEGTPDAPMTFGSGKGKPLAQLADKDLAWYVKCLTENVADPAKARYREQNQSALSGIQRELARRL